MKGTNFFKILFRGFLVGCAVLALGLTGTAIYLRTTFNIEEIRPSLERELSDLAQRPVTIKSLQWKWVPKPTLVGEDLRIRDKDGSTIYAIPETEAVIALKALWHRQLKIWKIILVHPTMTVKRSMAGRLNFIAMQNDIVSHSNQNVSGETLFSFSLRHVIVEEGLIQCNDEHLKTPRLRTTLSIDGTLDLPKSSGTYSAKFDGHINARGERGRFFGAASFPSPTTANINFIDIPPAALADYAPWLVDWKGGVNIQTTYTDKHNKTSWSVAGTINKLTHAAWGDKPVLNGMFQYSNHSPLTLNLHNVHTPWADTDQITSTVTWDTAGQTSASIESTHLRADGEQFELVTTTLTYANGRLQLDPLRLTGLQGNAVASVDFQPPTISIADAPAFDSFNVRWKINAIEASQLQNITQLKTHVSGRLNSIGSLSGPLNPFDWAGANGVIELDLSTGTLTGLPGVIKLLTTLNLHSLFRTFAKAKTPDGLPFQLIKTTVTLTNGVFVTSSPLVFRSDTLGLWSKGSISMVDKKMNLDVVVQPVTLVDEVLKAIPGIHTIFFNHRKTLVPIYVKVTGPLGDPNIDVQSSKSLGKSAWRTVIGVFKLPGTLAQDILKTVDKK